MANRRDYNYSWARTGTDFYQNGSQQTYSIPGCVVGYRTATDYARRHKPPGPFIAPTNYSVTESLKHNPYGSQVVSAPGYYFAHTGYWDDMSVDAWISIDTIPIPQGYPADLVDKAVLKLRTQMKGTSFNAAQALGERRQTASFIGNTLTNIAKSARDLRHGNFQRAMKRLGGKDGVARSMSDAILAWNYAVKPLCSDIYGAVEALDKRDGGVKGTTFRATETARYPVSKFTQTHTKDTRQCTGEILYGAFCRADMRPSNSSLITASQLGLTNPLSLAWELAPFSFVVDWALPLGDYFSQFDATLGWEVMGYSQSTLIRKRLEWSGVSTDDGYAKYTNIWKASYQYTSVNRSVFSSIPFAVKPHWKDPFSKQHVLNGLALLSSVFRGIK